MVEQLMELRHPIEQDEQQTDQKDNNRIMNVYQRQAAAKVWWDEEIHWDLFLTQIFRDDELLPEDSIQLTVNSANFHPRESLFVFQRKEEIISAGRG